MRFALVLAVLAVIVGVVSANAFHKYAVHQDLINTVNSSGKGWKAAHNKFSFWTVEEAKALLRTEVLPHNPNAPVAVEEAAPVGAVPASFDARDQWKGCATIGTVRDQMQCGSCWAFAAAETASDRYCIANDGASDAEMSPQYLVSCDTGNAGCNGGNLDLVWSWITRHGIVTDACMPYTSGGGDSGTCPSQCKDGSAFRFVKSKGYKHVGSFSLHRVQDIQTEIMTSGPVETGFSVYQDFMSYSSGVYEHTTGDLLGGHAVKILGWGNENGTDYWLVANSWGTSWGLNGFFKIKRGGNECGFEAQVYAGQF